MKSLLWANEATDRILSYLAAREIPLSGISWMCVCVLPSSVSVYGCLCVSLCFHVNVSASVRSLSMCVSVFMSIPVSVCVHVHACVSVRSCLRQCVRGYSPMRVCVHVRAHVCSCEDMGLVKVANWNRSPIETCPCANGPINNTGSPFLLPLHWAP